MKNMYPDYCFLSARYQKYFEDRYNDGKITDSEKALLNMMSNFHKMSEEERYLICQLVHKYGFLNYSLNLSDKGKKMKNKTFSYR